MKSGFKGFLALLYAAVGFGSFGVLVRLLARELSTYEQIFFRYVIALVILIFIIWLKKIPWNFSKASIKNILMIGIGLPLGVVFYTLSALTTKVAVTVFSLYLGSIVSSFFAGIWFFKESITRTKVISVCLALLGLLFFIYPFQLSSINLGVIFGLLSGVMDTLANGVRKNLSGKLHNLLIVGIPMIGGIFVSFLLGIIFSDPVSISHNLSIHTWFVGILFGLLLITINYAMNYGFGHFDLNLGTIILCSEVAFSLVFGFVFLDEIPTLYELLGGLFVATAAVLPSLSRHA